MISHAMRMNKLRARAGFTLIELMLVVSLIGIMSAIAVPSVLRLMQDRRSQRDALTLLVTLQDAHTRAFGRGAAVVMTITSSNGTTSPAVVGISESSYDINGAAAGGLLPNPACNGILPATDTAWWQASPKDTDFKLLLGGNLGAGYLASATSIWLCFTPRGDTYGRTALANPWQKLNAVLTFELQPKNNTSGITRKVDVLPNGLSRLRL